MRHVVKNELLAAIGLFDSLRGDVHGRDYEERDAIENWYAALTRVTENYSDLCKSNQDSCRLGRAIFFIRECARLGSFGSRTAVAVLLLAMNAMIRY